MAVTDIDQSPESRCNNKTDNRSYTCQCQTALVCRATARTWSSIPVVAFSSSFTPGLLPGSVLPGPLTPSIVHSSPMPGEPCRRNPLGSRSEHSSLFRPKRACLPSKVSFDIDVESRSNSVQSSFHVLSCHAMRSESNRRCTNVTWSAYPHLSSVCLFEVSGFSSVYAEALKAHLGRKTQ